MARFVVLSLAALAGAVAWCVPPDAGATTPPRAPLPTAPPPRPAGVPIRPDWSEDPGPVPDVEAAIPEIERKLKGSPEPRVPELPFRGPPPDLDPPPGLSRDDYRRAADPPAGPGRDGPNDKARKPDAGSFDGRTGKAKAVLLEKFGGTRESERAVGMGLAWLARQQKQDGSWAFDGQLDFQKERAGATGMALLPFLAAGVTHFKPTAELGEFIDGKGYEQVVSRGLDVLKKTRALEGRNAGRLSEDVYANAIAALALCEAFAMTKDAGLRGHAQAAVDFIQRTQGPNGSWGYGNSGNGDTSIVGWQVQVLRAAKLSKELTVRNEVLQKADKFLDLAAAGARKSIYGYNDNVGAAPGTALTAVGLLCRSHISEWGPLHPGLVDGAAGLLKNATKPGDALKNLYFHYYAAQVLFAVGGEDWKAWNEGPLDRATNTRAGGMRNWLVKAQVAQGAGAGSWDRENGIIGSSCGQLGTTCLCLLNLQVYYRYARPDPRGAGDKPVKVFD